MYNDISIEQRAHDLAISYNLYDSIQNAPEEPFDLMEFISNYKRAYEECKSILSKS